MTPRTLRRVIAGAVRSALAAHPEYCPPALHGALVGSVVKRAAGDLLARIELPKGRPAVRRAAPGQEAGAVCPAQPAPGGDANFTRVPCPTCGRWTGHFDRCGEAG